MSIPIPTPDSNPLVTGINRTWLQISSEQRNLVNLLTQTSNFIWKNNLINPSTTQKYTPQEVVAAFGTSAKSLFLLSSLLCTLLGTISGTAPNPMPVGWGATLNDDGTVTLTPPVAP